MSGAEPTNSNQPCTILRIKRKRNEESLDALVVETMRRKKSRGLGVFQYAETVEDNVWDNAERQKIIKDKISRLAQEKPGVATPSVSVTDRGLPSSSPSNRHPRNEYVRRYTIIDHDEPEFKRLRLNSPQVLSSKNANEQTKSSQDFKLYDAIPASRAPFEDAPKVEMDKFLLLLNDYLNIHDINPSSNVTTSGVSQGKDDYVWDVFYHRPATLSEWNATAANVGTLTGLPSGFEGYDASSDSDEEFLDEADEDSNAEEYYKNDYPDEEDDNDEFHEDSEYDSIVHYHDSEDDFD